MKKAHICSKPSGHPPGFVWQWEAADGSAASRDRFDLYYDCVCDAREHGYEVELTHAHGNTAPGGADFRLQGSSEEERS